MHTHQLGASAGAKTRWSTVPPAEPDTWGHPRSWRCCYCAAAAEETPAGSPPHLEETKQPGYICLCGAMLVCANITIKFNLCDGNECDVRSNRKTAPFCDTMLYHLLLRGLLWRQHLSQRHQQIEQTNCLSLAAVRRLAVVERTLNQLLPIIDNQDHPHHHTSSRLNRTLLIPK